MTTTVRLLAVATCALLLVAACGSDDQTPANTGGADAAQARVTAAEKAVTAAQSDFDDASAAFCGEAKDYVTALDRYGKLFDDATVTVGDTKTAGADLAKPAASVESKADAALAAHTALLDAQQELADAKAALAATGSSTSSSTTTTTTPPPLVPTATVDRVDQAQSDLLAVSAGITDVTPLAQATASFNAAAFALEVAWVRLFADAGCLTDDRQAEAQAAVRDYTVATQTALHEAGYYEDEIDGIYGPSTVKAVEKLQTDAGLTVTGFVDAATAAALQTALAAKGSAAATEAVAVGAAVQSTLKLAGYWTGPVDGKWTPELTTALQEFQKALGVAPTGVVDTATLQALDQAITDAKASTSTTTTSASGSSSTTTTSAGG